MNKRGEVAQPGFATSAEAGIPRTFVEPLLDEFGIVRNQLSLPLLGELAQPNEDRSTARTWWRARSAEEQLLLRSALNAMGAPVLVAELRFLIGRERFIATKVVMGSMQPENPVHLVGNNDAANEVRVRKLRDVDALIDLILFHLDLGIPMADPGLKLRCTRQELLVLLACVDLQERMFNAHLAAHSAAPEVMSEADIVAAVGDGFRFAGDIRWILPFALQAFPGQRPKLDTQAIRQELTRLVKLNVLRSSHDGYNFAESGTLLANSLRRRLGMAHISSVAATAQGSVAVQSSLLLRGDSALWFADICGVDRPDTVLCSVTLPLAEQLLKEIFRPTALPSPLPRRQETDLAPAPGKPSGSAERRAAQHPTEVSKANLDGKAKAETPRPRVDVEQPASPAAKPVVRRFCEACGAPVQANWKFCEKCGAKLD